MSQALEKVNQDIASRNYGKDRLPDMEEAYRYSK
jgi:hypothetical protein